MKKLALLSTLALATAASPLLGQTLPAPIFEHDFSTSSDPDAMPTSHLAGQTNPGRLADTSVWNVYRANNPATVSATTKYTEVTGANSPFGAGNQYLRLHYQEEAIGTLWNSTNGFSSASEVVTVTFDFFRPSTTSWGAANTGDDPRIRLGIADPVGSNNNRVDDQLFFNGDGSISGSEAGAYSFDTVHSISWVYNNSNAEISYENADLTIASGHYDVWLDGERILIGEGTGTERLARGTGLTSLGIMAGTEEVNIEMMFDNFLVYEGAYAIPEPSTYALGAGMLALGAAWMWRRRRAA